MTLPGEVELITRYFAPLATHPAARGLCDDAAVFAPPPHAEIVLTKDMLVADVHFRAGDDAALIARKALRVNLSDLAAMGAEPRYYLLAIALPEEWREDWLRDFAAGLAEDQRLFDVVLIGGDTVATRGPLTVSITASGTVPTGRAISRAGARPGDGIYVTGTIGDAVLGLALESGDSRSGRWNLEPADRAFLSRRYLLPRPRCGLVAALRDHARAAMDVSDGLAGDLAKLCAASGVGARIEAERIPLSAPAARVVARDAAMRTSLFTGGDDYEIVCTVSEAASGGFRTAAAAAGIEVTRIGAITAAKSLLFVDAAGRTLPLGTLGYEHF